MYGAQHPYKVFSRKPGAHAKNVPVVLCEPSHSGQGKCIRHDRIMPQTVQKAQLFIYIVQLFGLKGGIVLVWLSITITGRHIRAARALLGWTQIELSTKSKVALGTVKRMEGFDGPVSARTDTVALIVTTLQKAGVDLLNDGVREFG